MYSYVPCGPSRTSVLVVLFVAQASYAARNKFISGGADDADDNNITMTTLSFIFQASYHLYLGSNFILLVFDRDDCHCDGLQ